MLILITDHIAISLFMLHHTAITIHITIIIVIIIEWLLDLQHCGQSITMRLQFGLIHLGEEIQRLGIAPLGQASLDAFGRTAAILMVCVA